MNTIRTISVPVQDLGISLGPDERVGESLGRDEVGRDGLPIINPVGLML